jgi:hypothetical protein
MVTVHVAELCYHHLACIASNLCHSRHAKICVSRRLAAVPLRDLLQQNRRHFTSITKTNHRFLLELLDGENGASFELIRRPSAKKARQNK